jgi:hypothetical protein
MFARPKRRTRLGLEALEDRTVPSALFGADVVLGPLPPGTTDTWYQDRYRPAGFTFGQEGGGRDGVLKESISSADGYGSRPAPYNSAFYDFQGLRYDLAAGTTYLAADLYVPPSSSWSGLDQTDAADPAAAGSLASLWAAGVDASGNISNYPHIGFNNQAGGFQVKDRTTGGWQDVPGFSGYDQWYRVGFDIDSQGQFDFFVNGRLVYTDATPTTPARTTAFSDVMLQGYNAGTDYHIYWDNLGDTKATVADPVGANISATAGSAFSGVVATFTDPGGPQAAANYSATITWGDLDASGTPLTSQGTLVDLGGGHYQVVGSHTYAAAGTYPLSVSITGTGPSTANTSVPLDVGPWAPDRYAPAGFTPGQTGGGRDGVLDEFISAADQDGSRPPEYNSGFYDFQGRAHGLAAGTTYLAIDLYVPASWSGLPQQGPSGNPASWGSLASLWATGVDASGSISDYPILGFNNSGTNNGQTGTAGFQVFDQTNGWTNVGGFGNYGQWYQIGFGIDSQGQIEYFVNGQLVYTDTTPTGTTAFSTVMLQGYNGGNDYHIYWDNLRDTRATVADMS